MVCNICKKGNDFSPIHLTEDLQKGCPKCSKVIDLISNSSKYLDIYTMDLLNFLFENAPVQIEDKILVVNRKKIQLKRLDAESVIEELLKRLDLTDKVFAGIEQIVSFCNRVIGFLLDDFLEIINSNPQGYVIYLIQILEYNLFLTFVIIGYLQNKIKGTQMPIGDEDIFDNILIRTLSNLDMVSEDAFRKVYKEIESLIAQDKDSIQIAIQMAMGCKKTTKSLLK